MLCSNRAANAGLLADKDGSGSLSYEEAFPVICEAGEAMGAPEPTSQDELMAKVKEVFDGKSLRPQNDC